MLQRCLDYVTQKAYNIALEGARERTAFSQYRPGTLRRPGFSLVLEYYAKDDEKEIARKEQEEKEKDSKRNGIW